MHFWIIILLFGNYLEILLLVFILQEVIDNFFYRDMSFRCLWTFIIVDYIYNIKLMKTDVPHKDCAPTGHKNDLIKKYLMNVCCLNL